MHAGRMHISKKFFSFGTIFPGNIRSVDMVLSIAFSILTLKRKSTYNPWWASIRKKVQFRQAEQFSSKGKASFFLKNDGVFWEKGGF